MIPYSRQIIEAEEINAVIKTLKSNYLTQGKNLLNFENALNKKFNSKFSVGFNSATSALHISCLALGIKKGDVVWTCTNSFVASSNCALYCGAKVDLIDIDLKNFNINLIDLEKKLISAKKKNKLPKLVIPVHFAGLACDMKKIYSLSQKFGFRILEDASHAVGAKYYNNKVGNCKYSDITVFSFHPVKIITTAEGGAALTNNVKLSEKLKLFRNLAFTKPRFKHNYLGYNFRMTGYQAAMGLAQTRKLNSIIKKKRKVAHTYNKYLSDIEGLQLPVERKHYKNVYWVYALNVQPSFGINRDKLMKRLKNEGIETRTFFCSMSDQPCLKKIKKFKNIKTPIASRIWKTGLYLPSSHTLTNKTIDFITKKLKEIKKTI